MLDRSQVQSLFLTFMLAIGLLTLAGPILNMPITLAESPGVTLNSCGRYPTEKQFFDEVTKVRKLTVRTFTESGQKKMRDLYNMSLSRTNVPLLPPESKFYYAVLNPMQTGVVMILGGCVVPGSVVTVASSDWAAFVGKARVLPDEMVLANLGESI